MESMGRRIGKRETYAHIRFDIFPCRKLASAIRSQSKMEVMALIHRLRERGQSKKIPDVFEEFPRGFASKTC